ncbi:competence protein CoiA [Furfurilactobacillus siliginis]|nr:competence protein CoiA family protein [Furfurilactobacillus siliginis]
MAKDEMTGELKQASKNLTASFLCPGCDRPVHLRAGNIRMAYFAHRANEACETFSEGETSEHLRGKAQLQAWFTRQGGTAVLESPIRQLGQRPDILVNERLAVEFQCSPLSEERFNERVSGYHQGGYQQIWLLGRPYLPQPRLSISKISKFIIAHARFGVCQLYWQTETEKILVVFDIKQAPLLPIRYYQRQFDSWLQWRAWWLSGVEKPASVSLNQEAILRQRHALLLGLHHKATPMLRWQALCYQQQTHLLELPEWVYGGEFNDPCFINNELDWRIPLFLWWQAHPDATPRQQLISWGKRVLPRLRWLSNQKWQQTVWQQQQLRVRREAFFSDKHHESMVQWLHK